MTHAYSVNAHAVWSFSGKYQGCAKLQYYQLFCLKIMQMQLKIAAQVALSKRTLLVSFAIMCYTKELCIRPDTRIFKSSH